MHLALAATLLVAAGCGGSDTTGSSSDPAPTSASPTAGGVPGSDPVITTPAAAPVPLGTSAHVGEGWHLTIDAVDPDAASTGRQLGEPPAPGESFVLLDLTLEYRGTDEGGSPPGLVAMELVGDDGAGYDEWCNVSMDRQLNYQTLIVPGESISGQVCYRFPTDQLDSVLLVAGTSERTEKTFSLD